MLISRIYPPPSPQSCHSIRKSTTGIAVGLTYRMQKTPVALQIPKSRNTLNCLQSSMSVSKQKVKLLQPLGRTGNFWKKTESFQKYAHSCVEGVRREEGVGDGKMLIIHSVNTDWHWVSMCQALRLTLDTCNEQNGQTFWPHAAYNHW